MQVKAALAGEEVIIASHGKPQLKLVPCSAAQGLQRHGALARIPTALVDAAFAEDMERQVSQLMGSCRCMTTPSNGC